MSIIYFIKNKMVVVRSFDAASIFSTQDANSRVKIPTSLFVFDFASEERRNPGKTHTPQFTHTPVHIPLAWSYSNSQRKYPGYPCIIQDLGLPLQKLGELMYVD